MSVRASKAAVVALRRENVWGLARQGMRAPLIAKRLGVALSKVNDDIWLGRQQGEDLTRVGDMRRVLSRQRYMELAADVRGLSRKQLKDKVWQTIEAEPSLIDAILDDGIQTGALE